MNLRPAILLGCVVAALGLFAATRLALRPVLGPPGFAYVVTDAAGSVRAEGRAPWAIAPEVIPSPPIGGHLRITGSFLADRDGVYAWNLGSSSSSRLTVDGHLVFEPNPGLVRPFEQLLSAGPHAVTVEMPRADREGAIAFGVRGPGQTWRAHLVGPDEATTLPPSDVAARAGTHFIRLRSLIRCAPSLAVLLAVALAFAFLGGKRTRTLVAAYAADPAVQRVATVLLFAAIVLPMIAPLFDPGFYFCHEGEGYTVRLTQYQAAIAAGVPMGRWWPDPVYGRGYPFLCLYAPLLYLVATPFLLIGVPVMTLVKGITGAVVIFGAWVTYRLVRRRASRAAALVATALFTYAPYVQTNVWVRADLAECLGFPTFLFALLALERLLDGESDRNVALLALALAALGCSHNITAYSSVYFLALWLLVRWALGTTTRRAVAHAVVAGGLGLLLTLFYAIPAIIDARHVWIVRVMTGFYDPLRNLVPWSELLWRKPRWGMRTFLGIPAALACVAGVVALLVSWRRRQAGPPLERGLRTLTIAAASGTLMALAFASRPVGLWMIKYVPLANFVQFPFRMFIFAACMAPLCAAPAIELIRAPRWRWAIALAAIAVVMATALPVYGPSAPLVRVHVQTRAFLLTLDTDYVTSMNEYLPNTVRRTLPPFGQVAHIVSGEGTLSQLEREPGRYDALIKAATPAVVELNAHWFPGWRAEVDGKAVRIGPGGAAPFSDGGLIRVAVPAGEHHVHARYGRTALRWACDLVSAAVLLLVLFLLLRRVSRNRTATR